MAGKKSSGKHYTSKGERPNVNRNMLNSLARDVSTVDRMLNVQRAWKTNKSDPWVTIDNPNPNETNKKRIKIRARQLWGDPRKNKFSMSTGG